ncbi:MAG: hypothetical protein V4592_12285 [Bacteroidota bacterium]
MRALICILLLSVLISGCKKSGSVGVTTGGTVTVMGIIQPQGATTYMYGTHTIKNIDQYFALRSSTITLDDYKGKSVILTGNKVAGYPVDGGPDYLDVMTIKVQ